MPRRLRTPGPGMRTASVSGSGGGPTTPRCSPPPRRRIAEELPEAKLIVVVRDPIDRAYSNWMHLWVDGLEPIGDFVSAWHAEDERIAAGWAPFWHYQRLGRYGEQLADLFARVDRERVLVLRYWQLVSQPAETLNRVARFLGIAENKIGTVPPDNSRPFVRPGLKTSVLGRMIRAGATAGQLFPPQVWRQAAGRWSLRCSRAVCDSDRGWPRRSEE